MHRLELLPTRRAIPLRRRGTNWIRNDLPGYDTGPSQVVLAIADQPDTVLAIAADVYYGPFYLTGPPMPAAVGNGPNSW